MPTIKSVDVTFREENNQATARLVSDRVRRFIVKRSIFSGDTSWKIEMVAEKLDTENNFLFDRKVKEIKLTMQRDTQELSTDWIPIIIIKHKLDYQGSLPVFTVMASGLSYSMKLKSRWRAFQNSDLPSVVSTVSSQYGLSPSVENTQSRGTWLQTGASDWNFLNCVVRECTSGDKNLWIYVSGKNIFVKSIDPSLPPIRKFRSGDDRIQNMKFYHNGLEISSSGGNIHRVSGFDPYLKKYLEFLPPDSSHPDFANKLSLPFDAASNFYNTPFIALDHVRNKAAAEWSETTSKFFGVQVTTTGDLTLNPFDIINVEAAGSGNDVSVMNGKYPVYEVVHYFNGIEEEGKPFGLSTVIGGFRRTFNFGNTRSSSVSTSNIQGDDAYFTREDTSVKIIKEVRPVSVFSRR